MIKTKKIASNDLFLESKENQEKIIKICNKYNLKYDEDYSIKIYKNIVSLWICKKGIRGLKTFIFQPHKKGIKVFSAISRNRDPDKYPNWKTISK